MPRTRISCFTVAILCALCLALPGSALAITPAAQFGSAPGPGAGQIGAGAQGVAVTADGTLFVADPANHRIDVFAPSGAFVKAFGWNVAPGGGGGFETCTDFCRAGSAGGGAGQLSDPQGLAIAADGELYVADAGNDRIDVFGRDGAFARAFGWDVAPGGAGGFEFCTSACRAGSAGGSPGELDDPTGVAIGAGGDLFVAERGCVGTGCPPGPSGNRVSVFGSDDLFQRAFGWDVVPGGPAAFELCSAQTGCQDGTASGQAGGLTHPQAVGISPAGQLYVTEPPANRVSVFGTAETEFLGAFGRDVIPGGSFGFEVCSASSGCQAGAGGGGGGEMSGPSGVLSSGAGVFVADSVNNRVLKFSPSGEFVETFGWDVEAGDGTGFEICTTVCKAGLSGAGAGEFSLPTGLAADCRGAIYVTDSGNGRVERFAESDPRPPPCPDNKFKFGKVKLNKRKGSAKLTVVVPNQGSVVGLGHGVRRAAASAGTAGKAILKIRPKPRVRRKLREHRKAAVSVNVTYTPANGDPNSKVKRLTLRKPARHG